MIFPQVHQRQRRLLLDPLAADAFLVLSRRWSVIANHNVAELGDIPSEVRNLSAAIHFLSPVSQFVAQNDSVFASWLSTQSAMAPVQLDMAAWRAALQREPELWPERPGAVNFLMPVW